jgi:maltose O-acetyltransferase
MLTKGLSLLGLYPGGIRVGAGARVQRLRCLRLEQPLARIHLGESSIVYENARVEAYGNALIDIGRCSILGDVRIYSRGEIRIGERFLSSWNVFIQDFDAHPVDPALRAVQLEAMCGANAPALPASRWTFPIENITIGDDVWVGANATILKGARIGSGSIVAANAVVTAGDWPARSVLAGNPAKVVKSL